MVLNISTIRSQESIITVIRSIENAREHWKKHQGECKDGQRSLRESSDGSKRAWGNKEVFRVLDYKGFYIGMVDTHEVEDKFYHLHLLLKNLFNSKGL